MGGSLCGGVTFVVRLNSTAIVCPVFIYCVNNSKPALDKIDTGQKHTQRHIQTYVFFLCRLKHCYLGDLGLQQIVKRWQ